MHAVLSFVGALAACSLLVAIASGQSAKDVRGPSPLVAIENEPPAKLIFERCGNIRSPCRTRVCFVR